MNTTQAFCSLDHLVITAPTLVAGAAYIESELGVRMQPGGEHPRMGTHNLLLRLGATCYLEVIACSPTLPAPGRCRWFALDQLRPDNPAQLATWVARTPDIQVAVAQATENLGPVEGMSRGELNWLITIPPDGSIALDGTAPALIQWDTDQHPASRLIDQGLGLENLEIFHPNPKRVTRMLESLGMDAPIIVTESRSSGLAAHIETPSGITTLFGIQP